MKIALVDDEQKYLDEMAELVRDFGIQHCCQLETVSFLDGETFLEAFEAGSFSAVFMDIYMDGMDGVATALKEGRLLLHKAQREWNWACCHCRNSGKVRWLGTGF